MISSYQLILLRIPSHPCQPTKQSPRGLLACVSFSLLDLHWCVSTLHRLVFLVRWETSYDLRRSDLCVTSQEVMRAWPSQLYSFARCLGCCRVSTYLLKGMNGKMNGRVVFPKARAWLSSQTSIAFQKEGHPLLVVLVTFHLKYVPEMPVWGGVRWNAA